MPLLACFKHAFIINSLLLTISHVRPPQEVASCFVRHRICETGSGHFIHHSHATQSESHLHYQINPQNHMSHIFAKTTE